MLRTGRGQEGRCGWNLQTSWKNSWRKWTLISGCDLNRSGGERTAWPKWSGTGCMRENSRRQCCPGPYSQSGNVTSRPFDPSKVGEKRHHFLHFGFSKVKYQNISNNMHNTGNSCTYWTFYLTTGYVLRGAVISASCRRYHVTIAFRCSLVATASGVSL